MQHDHVMKKLSFDPKGWGGCGQNICYHVAVLAIPSNLICKMTMHVLKMLNFDLLTPSGGGGGKIFATMLLHS